MGFFIVFFLSSISLVFVSKRIDVILKKYIDVEVERLTNNVISKAVSEKMISKSYEKLYVYDSETKNISYDTVKINIMKNEITEQVQNILINLDNGDIDEFFVSKRFYSGRFKNIKNGIICDISIGSIRGLTAFSNVGPTIPIKLLFNGQIDSDIDVQVKEYGINNILIELYLIMEIKEQIIMPLTSKRKIITIRTPLSIDIIKGDIPEYYQKLLR